MKVCAARASKTSPLLRIFTTIYTQEFVSIVKCYLIRLTRRIDYFQGVFIDNKEFGKFFCKNDDKCETFFFAGRPHGRAQESIYGVFRQLYISYYKKGVRHGIYYNTQTRKFEWYENMIHQFSTCNSVFISQFLTNHVHNKYWLRQWRKIIANH